MIVGHVYVLRSSNSGALLGVYRFKVDAKKAAKIKYRLRWAFIARHPVIMKTVKKRTRVSRIKKSRKG